MVWNHWFSLLPLYQRPKVSIIGSREQLCINSEVLKQETNSAKVRKEVHWINHLNPRQWWPGQVVVTGAGTGDWDRQWWPGQALVTGAGTGDLGRHWWPGQALVTGAGSGDQLLHGISPYNVTTWLNI